MSELKDYKEKVYRILEKYPPSRDSDWRLLANYIYIFKRKLVTRDEQGIECIALENLRYLPPVESITRARRIIQNDDNNFLPTSEKVRKQRRIKEENYTQAEVREAKAHQVKQYKD